MRFLWVPVCLLSAVGLGQTSPAVSGSGSPRQDATARQVIQEAIQALAPSLDAMAFKSFALTGTMVSEGSTEPQLVKVLVRGIYDLRFEIAHQDGATQVAVTRIGGKGELRDVSGRVQKITRNARVGTEVPFLPLPRSLSDLLASAGAITDLGMDTVKGRAVHHVALSRQIPPAADPGGIITARSTIDLFIDAENFLVLQLAHTAADRTGRRSTARTVFFADYRVVKGAMVPFSISESLDGQKTWSITVNSIDFSHKFNDADFQL